MRDFRSFTPTDKTVKEEKKEGNFAKDDERVESMEKMIKDRENRSEDELMSELLDSVNRAKREGRFSEKELENFKNTVLPFLSSEQTKKLEEILRVLK